MTYFPESKGGIIKYSFKIDDIVLIRLKSDKLNSLYVLTYLKFKNGKSQEVGSIFFSSLFCR